MSKPVPPFPGGGVGGGVRTVGERALAVGRRIRCRPTLLRGHSKGANNLALSRYQRLTNLSNTRARPLSFSLSCLTNAELSEPWRLVANYTVGQHFCKDIHKVRSLEKRDRVVVNSPVGIESIQDRSIRGHSNGGEFIQQRS